MNHHSSAMSLYSTFDNDSGLGDVTYFAKYNINKCAKFIGLRNDVCCGYAFSYIPFCWNFPLSCEETWSHLWMIHGAERSYLSWGSLSQPASSSFVVVSSSMTDPGRISRRNINWTDGWLRVMSKENNCFKPPIFGELIINILLAQKVLPLFYR